LLLDFELLFVGCLVFGQRVVGGSIVLIGLLVYGILIGSVFNQHFQLVNIGVFHIMLKYIKKSNQLSPLILCPR